MVGGDAARRENGARRTEARHLRVVLVVGVLEHKLPAPLRHRQQLPRRSFLDQLEVLRNGAAGVDVTIVNALHVALNQRLQAWKGTGLA